MKTKFSSVLIVGTLSSFSLHLGAQELEEVTVRVHPLAASDSAISIETLSGDQLSRAITGSIGETVSKLTSIRNASFGDAVGRPVIRGLGGPRVKTTQDRIDSLDVSVTSTDHAVTIEPFIANQITILKGANSLLYGSGAIGGVVDVDTGRFAHTKPEKDFSGKVEVRGTDNANARTIAGRLDGKFSDEWAWHVDAFTRDADAYEIPGFAEVDADPDEEAGTLENSQLETEGGALALTHVTDNGHVGVSLSTYEGVYGLVSGHGEEEEGEEGEEGGEEEEESPFIDLEQTRLDIDGLWKIDSSLIESIGFRFGYNDYEHTEFESPEEIGTLFNNEAWEARLDIAHAPIIGFTGVSGIQLGQREFSALGEEAFVIPVDTDTVGLFWVGERKFDSFTLELGSRVERVEHTPSDNGGPSLDFTSFSSSLGLVFPVNESTTFTALLDYSNRAPSVEELYSNGAHIATQSFEIGNLDLDEETAVNLNFAVDYQIEQLSINASVFLTEFDGFIFESNTGEFMEGFPVLVYQQADATFAGFDLNASFALAKSETFGDVSLNAQFDRIRALLDEGANPFSRNIPRTPSDRIGVGLLLEKELWSFSIDYRHTFSQDNTAAFETSTASFDDVSLSFSHKVNVSGADLELFLNGRNLTDDEQRHHTSFVKDFAPAPGRRIEVGARLAF